MYRLMYGYFARFECLDPIGHVQKARDFGRAPIAIGPRIPSYKKNNPVFFIRLYIMFRLRKDGLNQGFSGVWTYLFRARNLPFQGQTPTFSG